MYRDPDAQPIPPAWQPPDRATNVTTVVVAIIAALFIVVMVTDWLTTTDAERARDRINETCNSQSDPIYANACRDHG